MARAATSVDRKRERVRGELGPKRRLSTCGSREEEKAPERKPSRVAERRYFWLIMVGNGGDSLDR
jgi:hypothetical protein